MARIVVALAQTNKPSAQNLDFGQDSLLRKLSKNVITHLRQNGIITLSLPFDLSEDKQVDWVKNTGYKADNGDILLVLSDANGSNKSDDVSIWYKQDDKGDGKRLVETISEAVKTDAGLTTAPSEEISNYSGAGAALAKQSELLAVTVELGDEKNSKLSTADSQDSYTAAIVKGIAQFLGINYRPLKKPAASTVSNGTNMPSPPPAPQMTSANDLGFGDDIDEPFAPAPAPMPALGGSPFTPPTGMGNSFGGGFPPPTNPSGFGNPGGGFGNNNNSPFNKPPMSRDERKDMINKWYKKGFGREPEQSDLNYFLNIGISEEQMLKRIVESQDHVDMVENAKKYDEIKKKFDEVEAKANSLERNLADQKEIMNKLNALLLQKNYALSMLQKKVQVLTTRMEDLQNNRKNQSIKLNYHGSAIDRIFDYFSRKLS